MRQYNLYRYNFFLKSIKINISSLEPLVWNYFSSPSHTSLLSPTSHSVSCNQKLEQKHFFQHLQQCHKVKYKECLCCLPSLLPHKNHTANFVHSCRPYERMGEKWSEIIKAVALALIVFIILLLCRKGTFVLFYSRSVCILHMQTFYLCFFALYTLLLCR